MRIGFFVWEYPPRIVGGLGTYAANMCPAMVKLGHDVSVFTMNDGTLKTRETVKGVDINRPMLVEGGSILPLCLTEDLRRWGTGIKFFNDVLIYNILISTKFANELIKKEGFAFDIICAHDWLSAMAGIMAKRETGLPYVFHLHSTEWGRALNGGSQTVTHIEKVSAELADRIITVSYPMEEDLIKHGIESEKINVCWNGIHLEDYDPKKLSKEEITRLRGRYGIDPEEKMILFVGRLTAVKGVINLVKAMPLVISKYPEAKLVILGKGELERTILDLISIMHLGDKVKTKFEFVPEEERILHYGACDLFVAPSVYEPFGIVALEAMAMEKPVVVGASGTNGFRDSVIPSGHDQTGIHVDGNNSADIAWGINSLLEDMERAREMGKRGRRRVEEFFTWDKIAEHTIRIYEDVIKEARNKL
ncbi:MAG: glycosyltransferase family 1 protein [Methanophagales archaeon ANME-1-THS]|nr:MAG: glycosyltransferase family 1 protein [Methanophagales archaeon ANME-1-THS]